MCIILIYFEGLSQNTLKIGGKIDTYKKIKLGRLLTLCDSTSLVHLHVLYNTGTILYDKLIHNSSIPDT